MSWNIYITRRIPDAALTALKSTGLNITMYTEAQCIPAEILKAGVADCQALLCLLTDKIDETILDAGANLKIIANYAVGYNNIDIKKAAERGIAVTNTPGVLTEATADCAFAMILAIARRLREAEQYLRDGNFFGWDPMLMLGSDLTNKTLGIVGAGRIGSAVARRAKGFNLKILYADNRRNEELENELDASRFKLNQLLGEADFVSLHVPLTSETFHLINRERLKYMKKTAYLVNTSRGPVVDEHALLDTLKDGNIAGAALDVFEFEPQITPGLLDLENVLLLPHIASATRETRTSMAMIAVRNIIAAYQGQEPPDLVNRNLL